MKQFNLEEYLKNPSRKVVTRDGDPVRILAVDLADEDFPIAAAIDNRYPVAYTSRGTKNYELRYDDVYDLFFAPEKHEGWVNVYRAQGKLGCVFIYDSEKEAKRNGGETAIATVKIEWEE